MSAEFWDRVEASGHDPAIVRRVMHIEDNFNKAHTAVKDQPEEESVYTAGGFANQARNFYFGLIDVDRLTHIRAGLSDAEINVMLKCIRSEEGNRSTIMIGQMMSECRDMVNIRVDVLATVKAEKEKKTDYKGRH